MFILRLAGIYGPGKTRNPVDSIVSGKTVRSIVKEGHVGFSRTHVVDISRTIEAIVMSGFAASQAPRLLLLAEAIEQATQKSQSTASGDEQDPYTFVLNVADDEPAPSHEVQKFACLEVLKRSDPLPLIDYET